VRDSREVRRGVATERDERHVLAAGPFDAAATHDALRVREQRNLEEHRRRVGRGARLVIPEARVEVGEIDRVAEQVVQRVFQRARQQLRRQIHGQEAGIHVDELVVGQGGDSTTGGVDRTFSRRS